MEATALSIRLLTTVMLLLVSQVDFSYSQKADEAFPRVVPNRQQHFEYESVAVSCEGLEGRTGWRVMKKVGGDVKTCAASWSTSTGPCTIKNAFKTTDSGGYWCEMGARKSNTVNITVTGGSVILESPVHPVMEGDNVTLSCRKKNMSSNLLATFFKDGYFMDSSSTGNLSIHSVSTSNGGLYKCSISGAGDSAESWMTVRAHEEARRVPQLLLAVVGVFLASLLLLVGLLMCRKRPTTTTGSENKPKESAPVIYTACPPSPPPVQSPTTPQTVSEERCITVPLQATYAVITKAMYTDHNL